MNVDDAIEALSKFFNDLIGAMVPGGVLVAGLLVMHAGPSKINELLKVSEGGVATVMLAGLLFALGHAILAAYEHALKPVLSKLGLIQEFDSKRAEARESYRMFLHLLTEPAKTSTTPTGSTTWDYHDLRSVAMSASNEAASLNRRFMHLSLLCNGVGTALFMMGLDFLACRLLASKLLYSYEAAIPTFFQVTLIFGGAVVLFLQGESFHSRAMTTPFSVAVAEMKFRRDTNAGKPAN